MKIGILGLLTADPSLYRTDSFGGAKIEPIPEAAERLVAQMVEKDGVDLILPLTHQSVEMDRILAQQWKDCKKIPVFCGGHDHEPYDETVEGSSSCRFIKTGMDAVNTGIIDIVWDNGKDSPPKVEAAIRITSMFEPNPEIAKCVECHKGILLELERARLFAIRDWMERPDDDKAYQPFSTRNNRLGPSTGTTAIATMLRMGLRCQVALMNAGSVRAATDYDPDGYFTWSDLKAEMPFTTAMTSVQLPGKVLQDTIVHSRQFSKQGVAKGGYLHASRSVKLDENDQIVSIQGKLFDPEKEYLTALPIGFLKGIDNHTPLLEWLKANPSALLAEDAAIPSKVILVDVFSSLLWLSMGDFDTVSGGDGVITKEDVRERMRQLYGGNELVADIMLNHVFAVADLDRNGVISPLEQMVVHFCACDMLDHVSTDAELQVLREVASKVAGRARSSTEIEDMVNQVRHVLDVKHNGRIQRDEILQVLKSVENDMLK